MKNGLLSVLATGLFVMGSAFIAHAALMEIAPISYSFDQTTDTGSYVYTDWGGIQLTDGQYGIAPWDSDLGNGNGYEWVGWRYDTPVNIDFDLGSSVGINQINIGTVQDHLADVVLPSVRLYSSSDGSTWTQFDDLYVPESTLNDRTYVTYEFTDLSVFDQYFRISLNHSLDGPWTFTDEIDFYVDGPAPVPEPATILLFGAGMAGFAVAGIRKKRNSNRKVRAAL